MSPAVTFTSCSRTHRAQPGAAPGRPEAHTRSWPHSGRHTRCRSISWRAHLPQPPPQPPSWPGAPLHCLHGRAPQAATTSWYSASGGRPASPAPPLRHRQSHRVPALVRGQRAPMTASSRTGGAPSTRAANTTGGPAHPFALAFSFGAIFTVCIRTGKEKSACHDSSLIRHNRVRTRTLHSEWRP